MPPVTYTLIDRVRAPIDRVFALLSDPARMPEWLPGCSAVEAEGRLKYGARFKVRFGTRLTELEIVDFAPPNTFGWVERRQRMGSKTFFRLDFVGGSTSVTVRDEWAPHSLSAWVQGRLLPKRDVPRHLKSILQNLQRLLSPSHEGESVQPRN
jgi:uncharacterized protein YndB with AHSA1/START domain